MTMQEARSVERLVLRGGAHPLLDGQRGQKLANLCFSRLRRVAFPVKEDEAFDPVNNGERSAGRLQGEGQSRAPVAAGTELRLWCREGSWASRTLDILRFFCLR